MACSFILRNSQDGLCPMTSSLLFLWTDGCLRASIILGNEQVSIQRQILLGPSYRISSRPFCFSHVMRSADKSSPARFPSMSRRPGFAPCCNSRRMTSASGLSFRTASIRGLYAPKSFPFCPLTGKPKDSKKLTVARVPCPEQAVCRALERLASAASTSAPLSASRRNRTSPSSRRAANMKAEQATPLRMFTSAPWRTSASATRENPCRWTIWR